MGIMDKEVKIKDAKIIKLSKQVKELQKELEKKEIDLVQMRSVYQGNVQLQDINTNLEKKIERLERKVEKLKGENNDRK